MDFLRVVSCKYSETENVKLAKSARCPPNVEIPKLALIRFLEEDSEMLRLNEHNLFEKFKRSAWRIAEP